MQDTVALARKYDKAWDDVQEKYRRVAAAAADFVQKVEDLMHSSEQYYAVLVPYMATGRRILGIQGAPARNNLEELRKQLDGPLAQGELIAIMYFLLSLRIKIKLKLPFT